MPLKTGRRLSLRRPSVMEYKSSVIFGQYHEKLADFARSQPLTTQRDRYKDEISGGNNQTITSMYTRFLLFIGSWPLLFLLGIIISFLSFVVDVITTGFIYGRDQVVSYGDPENILVGTLLWTAYSTGLILIAAIVVRVVSPQAAGAGVAEMKVIIRGVVIKEYLSFRTLVAKVIGVPFVLASGIGIGKEGPFIHISCMVAHQLFKIFASFNISPTEYDARFQELITIAVSVGVASTFASPIGAVLYSIEIVKCFFAVRSYWQGFFAVTWGALLWRLFSVWFNYEDNISHILPTDFRRDHPYQTLEILLFAILGLFCGLAGFLWVTLQRWFVVIIRKKSWFNKAMEMFPLLYPVLVSALITCLKYSKWVGKYSTGFLFSMDAIHELYSNFTWGSFHGTHSANNSDLINRQLHLLDNWRTEDTSIYFNTLAFAIFVFVTVALATTVPVPGGLIVPLFMMGGGFGRFFGEGIAYLFPRGLNPSLWDDNSFLGIIPGAYAVAGSAAMCGAVTGSLSVAVIAFEVTGQLTHFLPIIVSVLCANLLSRYLGPSIFESLIELKNLPFLPTLIKCATASHRVLVEDFMDKDVLYVWKGCTFKTLNDILDSGRNLVFYPYVSRPDTKFLLGTIHNTELKYLLESHLHKAGLKGKDPSPETGVTHTENVDTTFNISKLKKALWEKKLKEVVDFSSCHIDPAPLQILEGTPLSNIHNLFSLLSLQVVYVTLFGRLTGVVSVKHLRKAIEMVEKGNLPVKNKIEDEMQPLQSVC